MDLILWADNYLSLFRRGRPQCTLSRIGMYIMLMVGPDTWRTG